MNKIYIIMLIFAVIYTTKSDPYTDYILKADIRLNGNIYSSDFNQIGGFKNCCPQYESTFGLAPSIYFGGEIRDFLHILGYDVDYSILLGYNDLSANYRIGEYIGNDLGVDDYQRINVEHQLDINFSVLSNEHSFWFKPAEDLPLNLKLGVNLGIPLSKSFVQKEVLLSPSDATFPNGTKELNPANGEIPNSVPLLVGLGIGGRYKLTEFSGYELFANANFNYGLNSIAQDLNLNIHQASLGISLHYKLAKPDAPRPATPPMPPAPEPLAPPITMKPEMEILADFEGKRVNNDDTLKVTINRNEYITYASVLPILIFEQNSNNILKTNYLSNKNDVAIYDDNLNIYEKIDLVNEYPQIIAEYLKNMPDTKVKIIAQSEDESRDILNNRAKIIEEKLVKAGIDKSILSTEIKISKLNKTKNPAITEESRKVSFEFSKGRGAIEAKVATDYWIENFNKVLNLNTKYKAEEPYTFKGETVYNIENHKPLNSGLNQIVLSSGMFSSREQDVNTFDILASVEDSEGNIASDKLRLYLASEDNLLKTYINLNKDSEKDEIEEFVLGYTEFDKSNFYLVNDFALNYIRQRVAEGHKIEIIPLTDNIGTEEYNESLSRKRANSAIKLIGNVNDYEITLPNSSIFNNDSPYGRMMNRSVIIRIK